MQKTSLTGLAIIKAFEGCLAPVPGRPGYYKPYLDPVGVLTIGYGHTNHHEPKISSSTIWSQQQCDEALARDLAIFERNENLVRIRDRVATRSPDPCRARHTDRLVEQPD